MQKPSIHPQETRRLAALYSYQALDTLPEQSFDDLTKLASQICKVPIALVSLVDENRQWFKSCFGITADETSREISFCGHAILGSGMMEIPDATKDPRFADNPLVTGDMRLRFYAGVPLLDANNLPIGTICVIDHQARVLTPQERQGLEAVGRIVVRQQTWVLAHLRVD